MTHEKKEVNLELGTIVITRGISEIINRIPKINIHIILILERHRTGDWGEMGDEDKETNQQAIEYGDRVMSVYDLPADGNNVIRVWVITEADRSVTTILLPEEY